MAPLRFGRLRAVSEYNTRANRVAQFTRKGVGSRRGDQGAWNWMVGHLYGKGATIAEEIGRATDDIRRVNPSFEADFHPGLLTL